MGNDQRLCSRTNQYGTVSSLLFRSLLMLFSSHKLHRDTLCHPHHLFGIGNIHYGSDSSCQYVSPFIHGCNLHLIKQCGQVHRFSASCQSREHSHKCYRNHVRLYPHRHRLHRVFACEKVGRIDKKGSITVLAKAHSYNKTICPPQSGRA